MMAFVFGYAASSPLIVSPTDTKAHRERMTQTSLRSSLSAMYMATQIAVYDPGRRRLHSAACHLRLVAVALLHTMMQHTERGCSVCHRNSASFA